MNIPSSMPGCRNQIMGAVLHFLLPAPFSHLSASSSSSSRFRANETLTPQTPSFRSFHSVLVPSFRSSHSFLAPAAALKSSKGFGPAASPPKPRRQKQNKGFGPGKEEEEEDDDERDEAAGSIPEVVTNRMMRRMGLSVGIPLTIGILFFPFFYYLKVVSKLDVPNWIPFLVSFFFFGASLLGVSYGIVSASWDPLREGSLLGWSEARRNWPVFLQSFRGGGKKQ